MGSFQVCLSDEWFPIYSSEKTAVFKLGHTVCYPGCVCSFSFFLPSDMTVHFVDMLYVFLNLLTHVDTVVTIPASSSEALQ